MTTSPDDPVELISSDNAMYGVTSEDVYLIWIYEDGIGRENEYLSEETEKVRRLWSGSIPEGYEITATSEKTGCVSSDGKMYCFKDGVMLRNTWIKDKNGKKYYASENGSLVTGKYEINGTEYEFSEKGELTA